MTNNLTKFSNFLSDSEKIAMLSNALKTEFDIPPSFPLCIILGNHQFSCNDDALIDWINSLGLNLGHDDAIKSYSEISTNFRTKVVRFRNQEY